MNLKQQVQEARERAQNRNIGYFTQASYAVRDIPAMADALERRMRIIEEVYEWSAAHPNWMGNDFPVQDLQEVIAEWNGIASQEGK
jgi:hypothetical protein